MRPESVAEVKAAMERYNQYVLAMDAESVAASFTADGEVIDRGRSIARGRDAIRKFLASFKGVVRVDENATTIQSVNVQGDTALVTGTYRQKATLLAHQRTIEVEGRLEAEWVRQPTGEWLIRRMRTKGPG